MENGQLLAFWAHFPAILLASSGPWYYSSGFMFVFGLKLKVFGLKVKNWVWYWLKVVNFINEQYKLSIFVLLKSKWRTIDYFCHSEHFLLSVFFVPSVPIYQNVRKREFSILRIESSAKNVICDFDPNQKWINTEI